MYGLHFGALRTRLSAVAACSKEDMVGQEGGLCRSRRPSAAVYVMWLESLHLIETASLEPEGREQLCRGRRDELCILDRTKGGRNDHF